jgi:broad specificity phosphatase PhoE
MNTTVYLVRNGATDFSRDGRVAGRRDISLNAQGRAQAEELTARFAKIPVTEVLSSPLPRAVETAQAIATPHGVDVARDPRLVDFHAGKWEGLTHAELSALEDYRTFLADPMASAGPGGARISDARDRMVASLEQSLEDNELGAHIVIVSHAGPLRVIMAHYLGMNLGHYHRLRVSTGSVSVLRFSSSDGGPRVLALNCLGDVAAVTT